VALSETVVSFPPLVKPEASFVLPQQKWSLDNKRNARTDTATPLLFVS